MDNTVCWIQTIDYDAADPALKRIYDRIRSPAGQLDNLYRAFSLQPQTIEPADQLYRAAMHHQDNQLERRFSELIGVYVAILTGCDYAKAHHGHNYTCLHEDPLEARRVLLRLAAGEPIDCGTDAEVSALRYARKLCLEPESIGVSDVRLLESSGWSDGEILEIVQVTAMFSYFVRVINGLGIQLGDEKIGLY